jgi:hypothetical protein
VKTTRKTVLTAMVIATVAAVATTEEAQPRVPLFAPDVEGSTVALVSVDLRDPAGTEVALDDGARTWATIQLSLSWRL